MYFLIYGDDTYRSRRKLRSVREQFSAKRDAVGLNTAVFRAGDDEFNAVLENIFSSPFLAEKKLLVLEGFLCVAEADQERLEEALNKKPESTVVVWYENRGAKHLEKSPLLAVLSKQKFSEEFRPLIGRDLARFVGEEAKSYDCRIDMKAADLLTAATGGDSWQIHLELGKLCSFARGQDTDMISADLVRTMVAGRHEDSVFALIDACSEQRAGHASLLIENLTASGVSELQIASMLIRQFKTLIAVRDLLDRGTRDKMVIAKILGIHHIPVGKAMHVSAKWQPQALMSAYSAALEIDRQIKTSYAKPKLLLQLFSAKITTR